MNYQEAKLKCKEEGEAEYLENIQVIKINANASVIQAWILKIMIFTTGISSKLIINCLFVWGVLYKKLRLSETFISTEL